MVQISDPQTRSRANIPLRTTFTIHSYDTPQTYPKAPSWNGGFQMTSSIRGSSIDGSGWTVELHISSRQDRHRHRTDSQRPRPRRRPCLHPFGVATRSQQGFPGLETASAPDRAAANVFEGFCCPTPHRAAGAWTFLNGAATGCRPLQAATPDLHPIACCGLGGKPATWNWAALTRHGLLAAGDTHAGGFAFETGRIWARDALGTAGLNDLYSGLRSPVARCRPPAARTPAGDQEGWDHGFNTQPLR